MAEKTSKTSKDLEWESRVLCRDESCIGVIGPDGRCKECGKPLQAASAPDVPPETEGEAPESPAEPASTDESAAEGEDEAGTGDLEWESRVLCRDESCIGVIGPDGRCKECGKPLGSG